MKTQFQIENKRVLERALLLKAKTGQFVYLKIEAQVCIDSRYF